MVNDCKFCSPVYNYYPIPNLYVYEVRKNTLVTDLHGHCEAWIDNKAPIAGIVWHPERMQDPWIPEEIEHLLTK